MEVTSPGKVLFYGGYSVLLRGHISLSLAVVDEERKGVTAAYEKGERRIISKEFGIDREPSAEKAELLDIAYLVGEAYLKSRATFEPVKVEVENSPIFGSKEEKSGLGSSAAVVASTIKALFEANGYDTALHTESIFKLSQIAYAIFAKKIGSGFDIATASVGKSIVYYRYNPEEVKLSESIDETVEKSMDGPWSWVKAEPFDVSGLGLIVFNIRGAKTSSISAVKAWKEWKKSNEEEFKALMNKQDEVERKAIEALKARDFAAVRQYTHEARVVHREMQEKIKAIVPEFDPVEPEPLSHIIEEAESLPGIVAGRCPGAGGWDSLAFITDGSSVDIERIIEAGEKEGLKLSPLDVKLI